MPNGRRGAAARLRQGQRKEWVRLYAGRQSARHDLHATAISYMSFPSAVAAPRQILAFGYQVGFWRTRLKPATTWDV